MGLPNASWPLVGSGAAHEKPLSRSGIGEDPWASWGASTYENDRSSTEAAPMTVREGTGVSPPRLPGKPAGAWLSNADSVYARQQGHTVIDTRDARTGKASNSKMMN